MPGDENGAAAAAMDDVADRAAGCSCLPFCFWGSARSRGPASPERRGRRRRRFRFRLRLSWFSWPWRRRSGGGGKEEEEAGKKNKGKRRRQMLLLLLTSLQTRKALASVSSGSSLLPKLQVSSFAGAKMQNRPSKPRRTADDAAPTTSCAKETAPARPERPAGCVVWRAPSRLHSLQPDRGGAEPGAGGLWTAATTLGVIVFFGRVTAVFFLCSCLYGARRFRAVRAGGEEARGGVAGGGSSRRLGDRVAVDLWTEEYKKKVVMDGLLDRAGGKRPSSHFCK